MGTLNTEGNLPHTDPALKGSSVAILAMGLSHADYALDTLMAFGRNGVADETWGINSAGGTFICDRLFIMDDLRELVSNENDARMKTYEKWLKMPRGIPIYTSVAYEEFPDSVDYPLKDVLEFAKMDYMNSTIAYAFVYALYKGAKDILMYGCDFTYPDRHQAESGRGCIEYWIGKAMSMGVKVHVSESTTLMDQNTGRKLYGYKVTPRPTLVDGKVNLIYGDTNGTSTEVPNGNGSSQTE